MNLSAIHRIALTLILCLSLDCLAQEAETHAAIEHSTEEKAEPEKSCTSRSIDAVSDRPTFATSTETTQCGVIELLAGPERLWIGHGIHQDDLAEAVQLGLTRSLDFHYVGTGFFTTGSPRSGTLSGVSDTNLGLRFRFNEQRRLLPSLGLFYNIKVPTASVASGLSSGRFDHAVGLLLSKDIIPRLHVDFNAVPQIIGKTTGRPGTAGFDHNAAFALFASFPVHRRLTLTGGGFGFTRLNSATPAYASATVGFAWKVHPRLILDASLDEGITSFAPRKRVGVGFSYAPGNLYALFGRKSGDTQLAVRPDWAKGIQKGN